MYNLPPMTVLCNSSPKNKLPDDLVDTYTICPSYVEKHQITELRLSLHFLKTPNYHMTILFKTLKTQITPKQSPNLWHYLWLQQTSNVWPYFSTKYKSFNFQSVLMFLFLFHLEFIFLVSACLSSRRGRLETLSSDVGLVVVWGGKGVVRRVLWKYKQSELWFGSDW